MLRRRLPVGILLPALLVGLVGLLAALQYRWLGKVSEAERDQLSRSLTQRARELADDFDREITRLYLAMQTSCAGLAEKDEHGVAAALDGWRNTARYPRMVRGVFLAVPADGQVSLRRYNSEAKAFEPGQSEAWPPHLEPVRRVLAATTTPEPVLPAPAASALRNGKVQIIAISLMPVVADAPALVIPLARPFANVTGSIRGEAVVRSEADPNRRRLVEMMRSSLVVDLDREYLANVVLPALADRYFPREGSDGYRLAVTTGSGARIFQRGFPNGAAVAAERADVAMPIFTLRADLMAEALRIEAGTTPPGQMISAEARAPKGPGDGAVTRFSLLMDARSVSGRDGSPSAVRARVLPPRGGWRLVLQHGSGSLDAAVSQARRRNLWLSFGILAVLAAGVALVMINARRAGQLAARQMDFVATVSHELRTPLAVIRSAAQNLSAGVVADPAQAKRYGDLIEGEGRRLTDMVEQVLDYAGLEGQRRVRSPREVDIAALVEDVAASCRPSCEAAGCALEVDLGEPDEEVPAVMGDEAAIGRAVANLITNAAKHGVDGRWIGVKVSSGPGDGGREVQVSVSDRGRGIDVADLSHVFEPFRRGRHAIAQQIHGNGLGLSLVKRIVEAHGGRVTVRSSPGEGATFVISLPARSAPADAVAGSQP
ncbi:MAG TPA: HAMP domain-containing sensor histidine kinase [Vicinamibacterales bacterium]|jgi:signal transduction histidine kinase